MSLATNDGNTLLYNTHRFNLPQRRPNHSLRLPSHNELRKDSQSHNHNGDPAEYGCFRQSNRRA